MIRGKAPPEKRVAVRQIANINFLLFTQILIVDVRIDLFKAEF